VKVVAALFEIIVPPNALAPAVYAVPFAGAVGATLDVVMTTR
jgi:hypothetical protein